MIDIQELIKKVKERYTCADILDMLDEEIFNWDYGYTESEIDEYESRFDFYYEYNNGEAENVVVDNILSKFGTSRNELFEENEDYLLIFEEWLEDYTSHNFNV